MNKEIDVKMMKIAFNESLKCSPDVKAFAVGSVIVDKDSNIISTGYSRETADNVHAEEVAIAKALLKGINLTGMTIYATMEPCGERLSGKKCCADRIIDNRMGRCVYGVAEPIYFVEKTIGLKKLLDNGIILDQITDYNIEIMELNNHAK